MGDIFPKFQPRSPLGVEGDFDRLKNQVVGILGNQLGARAALQEVISATIAHSLSGWLGYAGDFGASDPRDKIYAVLALRMWPDKKPFAADYSLPVEEVYTFATRYYMEETQKLSFWWDRNGRREKKIARLPS